MAIVNSAAITSPGFGSPAQVVTRTGVALSTTGAVANPLPATGSLAQTFRTGKVRVKIYGGAGTSPTVVALTVTVTDGTTTEQVASYNPAVAYALAASQVLDLLFTFICDINANVVNVNTTLGGTTPTASLDAEAILEP